MIKSGVQMNTISYPQGHVLLRKLKGELPFIDRGEGIYLYDKAGKKYIDGSSGAYVASVGHCQKEVVEKIKQQLDKISYVNGRHFATEISESLASKIVRHAPKDLDKVFYLSSGSEAVEAAIKFARQYFYCKGLPLKQKVISQVPGYHGNTIFAISISGRAQYKKFFAPYLQDMPTIEAPMAYRCPVSSYEDLGSAYYLEKLEKLILEQGPQNIACLILEPVGGSSTGGACPPANYLKGLKKLCEKHEIFCIADEVLVGVGRTGYFFASEKDGFCPDIITLAKGLNGGYAALSAMVTKTEYCDLIAKESGGFLHAQTFVNYPLGCAAGDAVVDFIEKHGLIENSKKLGKYFLEKLSVELGRFDCVGNVTGRGLLLGIELVADKKLKTPFSKSKLLTDKLQNILFDLGLVTWGNSGHVDGENGDIVLLAPPLIVKREELDQIAEIFKQGLALLEKEL